MDETKTVNPPYGQKDTRCTPVYVTEDPECVLDYRHRPKEPKERRNPADSKRLADRILVLAVLQDALYVLPENLDIEAGFACTACGQTGQHTRQCAPPRGMRRAEA